MLEVSFSFSPFALQTDATQERQYLWRLMLDLQGNSRSSLEFYRLGKVLGEGSFAKVRHGLLGASDILRYKMTFQK